MRQIKCLICILCLCTPFAAALGRNSVPMPSQPVIAVLKSEQNAVYDQILASFRGRVQAKLVEFNMNGNTQSGRDAVAEINQGNYNLVLAIGASAALIAKEQSTIPVVFCGVFGSDRKRLTGRNITGITLDVSAKEQFTTLRKLIPSLKVVGVVYNPKISSDVIHEAQRASTALGIRLETRAVSSSKEVTWAVRDLAGIADILWLIADSTVANADNFRFMLLTSIETKVPLVAFSHTFVREGALASVSVPPEDAGAEAAVLVNNIINGQPVSSIPISSPKRATLFINLKTAHNIGINVPSEVLAAASVFGRES
ncbi:MAG TPA: ABC transporter substrate-binding protein [Blastocatellia bacterium]|nr:ABC transporter substrate-binding protein [Blastocatellia bacterium]